MSMTRLRELSWRRELPPVLVVAALAADYLSPPALWTVALPLAGIAALVALGQWRKAALVLLLSSWIAIPASARALCAVEAARGVPTLYAVEGVLPAVWEYSDTRGCALDRMDIRSLDADLGSQNRFVRQVVWSFVEIHNATTLENAARLDSVR
jgi:hypothetical protein